MGEFDAVKSEYAQRMGHVAECLARGDDAHPVIDCGGHDAVNAVGSGILPCNVQPGAVATAFEGGEIRLK